MLEKLGEQIFTEAGIVAFLLFAACVYLHRLWSMERKDRKELAEKTEQLLIEHISATQAQNTMLNSLTGSVDRLCTMVTVQNGTKGNAD